jgi:hypothetical protein
VLVNGVTENQFAGVYIIASIGAFFISKPSHFFYQCEANFISLCCFMGSCILKMNLQVFVVTFFIYRGIPSFMNVEAHFICLHCFIIPNANVGGIVLCWDDGKGCRKHNSWIGCPISRVVNARCHGNRLYAILATSRCKGDLSLTLGGVEKNLFQPTTMWMILRRDICFYCSCSSFRVGFGCLARFFQVDNEIQLCSSHGWNGGHCIW